ncbi:MAG: hypothetical protein ABH873_09450 [Candidatus Firestonebacteria bacterium]
MSKEPKTFIAVTDIVLNSLKIFYVFNGEFENFKKEKKCDFGKIDKLEKDLYDLKNVTHSICRENIEEKKEIKEMDLYDLIMSSIFHEMLHLKEYIYILNKYEPSYLLLEKQFDGKRFDEFKKTFLKHSREIVGGAMLGLPLKMQGVSELVNDASSLLLQIIKINSFDTHLIRTLYVCRDIVDKVYPSGGLEYLYANIYGGGWIEGYFLVAESFTKSGFSQEAREIFQKIVKLSSKLNKGEDNYKTKLDYLERARLELKYL